MNKSILELGAWVGVLINGILADTLGAYLFSAPPRLIYVMS